MSLFSDVAFARTTKLDQAELNRRMKVLTDAIEALRQFAPDWQEQVDALRAVGLERIDDALLPIYDRIMEVAHLGTIFSATSASVEEFGLGIKRFVIPEQQRPNFAPSRFLLIMAEGGSFDVIMLGRLSSYDRETGELAVLVENSTGEGTRNDWIIGPYVTSDGLEDLRAEVEAARVAAAEARDTAAGQALIAAGHAATATNQSAVGAGHAATATAKAVEATSQAIRAEAAAAALSGAASDVVLLSAYEPSLDIDFTVPEGFVGSFARASAGAPGTGGYRLNGKGILVPEVSGEPAINFDAGSMLNKGAAFFNATTNMLIQSLLLENTSWALGNASRATAAIEDPTGATAAVPYIVDTGTGVHSMEQELAGVDNTVPFAFSAFIKPAGGRNWMRFVVQSLAGTPFSVTADVDVSGGPSISISVAGGASIANVHSRITPHHNGWYRVEFSFVGTGSGLRISLVNLLAGGVANYPAGANGNMYLWGVQLSDAVDGAGPVIPNNGGVVSRAADSLSITGSEFTEIFNRWEWTIFVDYQISGPRGAGLLPRTVWSLRGGSGDNSLLSLNLDPQSNMPRITSGSLWSGQIAADGGNAPINTSVRVAVAFKNLSLAMVRNGGAAKRDAGVGAVSPNTLSIGSTPSALQRRLNGYVKRLILFPRALPDTDLQRMTA